MSSSEIVHALTFDVEDWYQGFVYRGIPGWEGHGSRESASIDRILNLLDEFNMGATFFVLGKFAESHPEVVRSILSKGHEIATHGYEHKPVPWLGKTGFRDDLRRSIEILGSITGTRVLGHRAASWSLTKECLWALEIVAEEGLEYDSSIFPSRFYRFGHPGFPAFPHRIALASGRSICEFPAQVISVWGLKFPAAGGFYLRALPLFVSRWALRQSDQKKRSGMVYLHPFDLDADAPVLKTGLMFRIIRYHNLDKTESYLKELLKEFKFSSIREILTSQQVSGDTRTAGDAQKVIG